MAREGRAIPLTMTFGYVVFLVCIGILLILESTHGLDQKYINIFGFLLVMDILAIMAFGIFSIIRRDNEEKYTPTIFDNSAPRGLAQWNVAKWAAMVFLIIFFVGGSLVAKASIIPIINPYDVTTLVSSGTLSETFLNGWRTAGYQSVIEDTTNWVIITSLTLLILWGLSKLIDEPEDAIYAVIPTMLVASVISGLLFATAHQLAYGINGTAYIGAFLYFFVSGFVNELVGAPVSIVAHFLHNFVLVFTGAVAFNIGGIYNATTNATKTAAGAFIMKLKRTPKQGQAALWIILGIAALIIVGGLIFLASYLGNKPLSITGSSSDVACNTWTSIPGMNTCHSDTDCQTQVQITSGGKIDAGTQIRCANNACEAMFTSCSASVSS